MDEASLRSHDSPISPTLTRVVRRSAVRVRNTSSAPFQSPGTRFDASDEYATTLPSALTNEARLAPFASLFRPTLTRSVPPVARSRTKMSWKPLRSRGTRFVAADGNATIRPSALIDGFPLAPSLSTPFDEMLALEVLDVRRSRTKTSRTRFRSCGTRFAAPDTKAT
jgi:hypothetical protein